MFLGETISVLDTKARNEEKEIFYHGILIGILKIIRAGRLNRIENLVMDMQIFCLSLRIRCGNRDRTEIRTFHE